MKFAAIQITVPKEGSELMLTPEEWVSEIEALGQTDNERNRKIAHTTKILFANLTMQLDEWEKDHDKRTQETSE